MSALKSTSPCVSRRAHLRRNRLCELVALLMHDDSGFVDDCLDLRRELQTSVVSVGPMSLDENKIHRLIPGIRPDLVLLRAA